MEKIPAARYAHWNAPGEIPTGDTFREVFQSEDAIIPEQ